MPYVWFLVICFIWGSSFISMKRAAVCMSPAGVSAGRVVFGALVLAGMWWLVKQRPAIHRRDWLPVIGVLLVGFAWPYTVQPWLIAKHQNSAFIAMMVAFTPLMTLGVSTFILGTRPTLRQMIGVTGALGCLSLLLMDAWTHRMSGTDLAFAVSVPLSYAVANTWIRRWLTHIPAIELTFYCLFGAGIFLMPLVLASETPATAATGSWAMAWAALAFLGIVGSGLSNFLFNRLVQEQGPLFATMVTNIVPIGAMAWGWIDEEVITGRQVLAVCGVLLMVAIVQFGAATQPKQRVISPPTKDPEPAFGDT